MLLFLSKFISQDRQALAHPGDSWINGPDGDILLLEASAQGVKNGKDVEQHMHDGNKLESFDLCQ